MCRYFKLGNLYLQYPTSDTYYSTTGKTYFIRRDVLVAKASEEM